MINIIFKLLSLLLFSRADFDENFNPSSELLGYRNGIVGNETFVYYYVHHSGNILISLTSSEGDADLYISETRVFPTFYPESYDLHSATCGTEVIEIPLSFKSPIAVGVYGHSAHELSVFVLEIFRNPKSDIKTFAIIVDELPQSVKEQNSIPTEDKAKNPKSKTNKRKTESVASNVNGFFSLFEIIGLIFL
ncbi:unnamed protein product [Psylliodes chrysocephalus]|uniref:Uncharacterized protein n=1 Tax=Psylliodes chrysocephalus TaxID=3402493 RepID=A0A9P0CN34_9CUCU|nr:unnamed protein product [Psylliodes chrysocephala]